MAKALATLGHPRIAVTLSSKFGDDWWKIEGDVSRQINAIFSLSLSLDMVAFHCSPKSFRRSTDSNDVADRDLFRQVALRSSDVAPSIGPCCAFAYDPFLLSHFYAAIIL